MATPTNLIELAAARLATWQAEKTAAQSAVQTAQTELVGRQEDFKVSNDAHAAQTKAIADARAALALIATPADAAPLLQQLQTAIIAQRGAAADIVAAESALVRAQSELEFAREGVRTADAGIVEATAEQTELAAAHAKRESAKAAIAASPLSTLGARATSILASATFSDAETRIETDFPEALRERAQDRATLADGEAARATQAASDALGLLDAHYAANGNAVDKVAALERALQEADEDLFDFVSRAVNRCDAAEATLLRIGSTSNPALTAEERAAIEDATLETDREGAAAAEADRDTALDLQEQALATYSLEELRVRAEDGEAGVAAALADATSDLAKAKEELDDAAEELETKRNDYDSTEHSVLDAWEAAVPDSAWRDLADFDAAGSSLIRLQASPAGLVTAVNNAEAALLAALIAADDEIRSIRVLRTEAMVRIAAADAASKLAERARFSALRGDIQ